MAQFFLAVTICYTISWQGIIKRLKYIGKTNLLEHQLEIITVMVTINYIFRYYLFRRQTYLKLTKQLIGVDILVILGTVAFLVFGSKTLHLYKITDLTQCLL